MIEFSGEQLNYFKIATIVIDELSKGLRQTFKSMWDNKFGPGELWDDSDAVRNSFLLKEGGAGSTEVPTDKSYEEWDCTALFQATIFAKSFALPDSTGHLKTLNDLYVRPCSTPRGDFHSSVVSLFGNQAETFALAIDQLRRLRNSFAHVTRAKIHKKTFDLYIHHTLEAFVALGLNTESIDAIGKLTESDFPTKTVENLRRKIFYLQLVVGVGLLR